MVETFKSGTTATEWTSDYCLIIIIRFATIILCRRVFLGFNLCSLPYQLPINFTFNNYVHS